MCFLCIGATPSHALSNRGTSRVSFLSLTSLPPPNTPPLLLLVIFSRLNREYIADLETPVSTLLKIRAHSGTSSHPNHCFLLESVEGGERVARYSFVGAGPRNLIVCGADEGAAHEDPLRVLESALSESRPLTVPGVILPAFTGGAVGYVGYDCVRYFEPRVSSSIDAQPDALAIPAALFMLVDTVVVFDHVRHTIKVVSYARLPEGLSSKTPTIILESAVAEAHNAAAKVIDSIAHCLAGPVPPAASAPRASAAAPLLRPAPWSPPRANAQLDLSGAIAAASSGAPSPLTWAKCSNVGQQGYEAMVLNLKEHIVEGDIIQAVPSQRITIDIPANCSASALDIYRQLRILNPSPYMFYLECDGLFVSLSTV